MGEVAPVQSKDILNALAVKGDIPWCTLRDLGLAVYYAGGNHSTGPTPPIVTGKQIGRAHV